VFEFSWGVRGLGLIDLTRYFFSLDLEYLFATEGEKRESNQKKEQSLKAERLPAFIGHGRGHFKDKMRYRLSSANTCYSLGGLCSKA